MRTPVSYRRHTAADSDVQEILRLNREWWESNIGLVIPRMVQVFPSPGEDYLMFNSNGHTYYGMKEKVALWEWYRERIDMTGGLDVRIMRLEVDGDVAWLACEATVDAETVDGAAWAGSERDTPRTGEYYRATEIYRRDRGDGRPEWRMWHTHISPSADPTEPRPGFGDTLLERGLGWVPWNPLPESRS